jgi:membrane protease YdiL (CAAX protease family)
MFDFARPQVNLIYGMKEGENPIVLSLLMLFIIGPAEEIFWRGYIQNNFSKRWNPNIGFIVTTLIYGLVHISKFNFMLIMAALVAGFIWGLAYRFFPERLGAIILSHALWDCAVFIWFPI